MQASQQVPHRFEGGVRHHPVWEGWQSHIAGDEGQLLATVGGETDGARSRVEALLPQREEVSVEGVRVVWSRAVHQRTPAEDRPRVHHAAGQWFAVRPLASSRHVDHATAFLSSHRAARRDRSTEAHYERHGHGGS